MENTRFKPGLESLRGLTALAVAVSKMRGIQEWPLWRYWWLIVIGTAVAYYPRFIHPGGMEQYAQAANCVLHQQVIQQCALMFTYPPAFAFLMIPFTALPSGAQVLMWYIITIGCTIACCELSTRIALRFIPWPWTVDQIFWLRAFGLLLSLKFIMAVYETQGFDLLVLPFILLGVLALMDEHDIRAGASLAVAAALKVTPLLFLPYLLVRRRFIAAGAFIFVFIAASFSQDLFFTPQNAPHGYFMTWIHDVAAASVFEHAEETKMIPFWDGVNIYNLSLRGMLARFVDDTPYKDNFVQILRVSQIAFIALIGILVLASMRSKAMIPIESSLLIIAMLILSPMTSRTHYVNLMLPYYVLVAAVLHDRKTRRLGAAILALSFLGCTGIPRDLVPKGFTEFMRDHNDIVLGTLALLGYLAVIAFRHPPCKMPTGEIVAYPS